MVSTSRQSPRQSHVNTRASLSVILLDKEGKFARQQYSYVNQNFVRAQTFFHFFLPRFFRLERAQRCPSVNAWARQDSVKIIPTRIDAEGRRELDITKTSRASQNSTEIRSQPQTLLVLVMSSSLQQDVQGRKSQPKHVILSTQFFFHVRLNLVRIYKRHVFLLTDFYVNSPT